MTWATIIAALLKTFGPLLSEWLQKWLEGRLKAAAEGLPADGLGDYPQQRLGLLFDRALADTPRRAFGRRALLRRLKAASVPRADLLARGGATIGVEEAEDIRDLAAVADGE